MSVSKILKMTFNVMGVEYTAGDYTRYTEDMKKVRVNQTGQLDPVFKDMLQAQIDEISKTPKLSVERYHDFMGAISEKLKGRLQVVEGQAENNTNKLIPQVSGTIFDYVLEAGEAKKHGASQRTGR